MQDNERENFEEALIAKIKNTLSAYEEPYAEGAWERFAKKDKKRRGIIWWIGSTGIAAAILLTFFVLPGEKAAEITRGNDPGQRSVPIEKPLKTPSGLKTDHAPLNATTVKNQDKEVRKPGTFIRDHEPVIHTNERQIGRTDTIRQQKIKAPVADHTVIAMEPEQPVKTDTDKTVIAMQPEVKQPLKTNTDEPDKQSFEDFLRTESAKAAEKKQPKAHVADKWGFGVILSPAVGGANKVDMGYGMEIAYALSDKVGIRSGLSYNRITGVDNGLSYGSADMFPGGKMLESTSQIFTGLSIPIDVKYKLGGNLYASAGISAMAVFEQQQSNDYLETRQSQVHSTNEAGQSYVQNVMVTTRTNQRSDVPDSQRANYIGFYNFSLGYQRKFSKKYTWSAEPFVRLPVRSTQSENLNLVGAGIKFKFGF